MKLTQETILRKKFLISGPLGRSDEIQTRNISSNDFVILKFSLSTLVEILDSFRKTQPITIFLIPKIYFLLYLICNRYLQIVLTQTLISLVIKFLFDIFNSLFVSQIIAWPSVIKTISDGPNTSEILYLSDTSLNLLLSHRELQKLQSCIL